MSLSAGTRLGSYTIGAPIGAGGMGEVYRARDARLQRDVAIKILPASVSADADRRARFEREARAVAALSHPNVVAVHEFGDHDGRLFVVMELLEGQTLRGLLDSGALPVRKTIDLATQVARGLAAAHQKQLVHRDLKPENIFVRADGQVKILDFGLALSIGARPDAHAAETVAHTDPGTVLGTVGYMAPEQVRGGAVDARADLFAFGAVLYEMLAGRRAFQRDTAAETMTAVLKEDPPDLVAARGDLPPALDRIVQHALEKDPQARFQTASDIAFALTSLSGQASTASGAMPVDRPSAAGRRWGGAAALAGAVAVAALAGWVAGRRNAPIAEARWDRFTQLTDDAGEEAMPVISPDGGTFAFASHARGSWDLYVQRAGGRNPQIVAGNPTRQEVWPRFSPDGKLLAFSEQDADGGIFIIGATGESERRLTDFGGNPAWSPDGTRIAFATETVDLPYSRNSTSALHIVDVAGGAPRKLAGDEDAVQPKWSPTGRRIAFWSVTEGQRDIATVSSDGSDRVAVTNDPALDWAPEWSPDGTWIYFASDRGGATGLWRIAIDEASGRPSGDPESVSPGVEASMDLPSFSADGRTMLFRSLTATVNPAAIPFDPATERAGTPRVLTSRTGVLRPASVSPDGQWVSLSNLGERQEDVFLMRSDGTGLRRLTDDLPRDRGPRWMPDGAGLVFYSNRGGVYAPWSVRADGSGLVRLLEEGAATLYPSVSPADGRLVVLNSQRLGSSFVTPPFPAKGSQIQALSNDRIDGGAISPSLWSPDGQWLSGAWSSASGEPAGVAVYDVRAGRARKLTTDRGLWLVPFLPDSRRVIYMTTSSELVVVDIATGARRAVPVTLPLPAARESFVAAPDGRTLYYGAERIESNVWKVERRQ